jgi:hypothetical protein
MNTLLLNYTPPALRPYEHFVHPGILPGRPVLQRAPHVFKHPSRQRMKLHALASSSKNPEGYEVVIVSVILASNKRAAKKQAMESLRKTLPGNTGFTFSQVEVPAHMILQAANDLIAGGVK